MRVAISLAGVAASIILVAVVFVAIDSGDKIEVPTEQLTITTSLDTETALASQAQAEVAATYPKDAIEKVTDKFLGVLDCLNSCTSGKDAALTLGKLAVTTALGLIPGVGPAFAGIVSMFWPGKSDDSMMRHISQMVDKQVGEATRGVKIDWVVRELDGIRTELSQLSQYSDCDGGRQGLLTDVSGALTRLEAQMEYSWDGTDPDNVGGTQDVGALKRSLLLYLPQVSLLTLIVRGDILETSWLAENNAAANLQRCTANLGLMKTAVNNFIKYGETAVANLKTWKFDSNCEFSCRGEDTDWSCTGGSCAGSQWEDWKVIRYGVRNRKAAYACGTADSMIKMTCPSYAVAAGCKYEHLCRENHNYHARRRAPCQEYTTDFGVRYRSNCVAQKQVAQVSFTNDWNTKLLAPLGKWRALVNSLEQYGYCRAMQARGVVGTRQRMNMKSFTVNYLNMSTYGHRPGQVAYCDSDDDDCNEGSLIPFTRQFTDRWQAADGEAAQGCGTGNPSPGIPSSETPLLQELERDVQNLNTSVRQLEQQVHGLEGGLCQDKCNAQGHCCVGLSSGCQHPSCAMGCAIGQKSESVSSCEKACDDADSKCSFVHEGLDLRMCDQCPSKCGGVVTRFSCGGDDAGTDGCKLGCKIAFESN